MLLTDYRQRSLVSKLVHERLQEGLNQVGIHDRVTVPYSSVFISSEGICGVDHTCARPAYSLRYNHITSCIKLDTPALPTTGLISIFFGQRACKKIPERFGKVTKPVQNVAVVGAGLMGAGIAEVQSTLDITTPRYNNTLDITTDFRFFFLSSTVNSGYSQLSI